MERSKEGVFQDNPLVHVVCYAGTDRSRLIAEELNKRGWVATHGGVQNNQNYTTTEDLDGVGVVIFTSEKVKDLFMKDPLIRKVMGRGSVETVVLCITEQEKEHAFQGGVEKLESFKSSIRSRLDLFGFKEIEN